MAERATTPPSSCTTENTGKMRILLQTVTHLVPGNDYGEKITFIQNLVRHHQWQRDYDVDQERWYPYRDYFGLPNRRCFFLIDHHGHDHTVEEEKVPMLWYRWTGEALYASLHSGITTDTVKLMQFDSEQVNEQIPGKITRELTKWPFTWAGRPFHTAPRDEHGQTHVIRSSLRLGIPLSEDDVQFLRAAPAEDAQMATRQVGTAALG